MPTATKTRTVTFISRYAAYTMVRKPAVEEIVAGLGKRIVQKPVRYEFHDMGNGLGKLTVREGDDVMQDSVYWLAPGEDVDEERDVVTALKAHRSFGDAFWEDGHAPGTQYPKPEEIRAELDAAIATLNRPVVEERAAVEAETHGRPDILAWCESALNVIGLMEAELERKAAESAQKGK